MLTQQGRFRAEWVIVIGFLLVMSGFLAYLNYREYQQIEQREREFLAHQARLLDRNLVPRVRAIDRALLAFRDDIPRRLADAGGLGRASQRMSQTVETLAGVRTMVWMDPAGRVVASSSPDLQGRDLSQQPNFRRIAASPNSHVLYLTPPFKTVVGSYSFALARVVTGRDGAFQGLLMAIVDPEYLRTLLESVIPSADSRSFIVHGNGILLMMSPQLGEDPGGRNLQTGESLVGQFMSSSLLETVYSGKSGLFGDERMVALRRVPHFEMSTDNELVVIVSRGHEAVFANWNSAVRVEAAALAAFACFSIGALVLYQRRMRAAFDAATTEARRSALAADSHKRVTIQMAAAFASMTEAVAVMDTEGTLLAFNDAYARFHRYGSVQECQTTLETGRMLVEVLSMAGDVLPLGSRPMTRALAGESATGVACRLMRKDTGEAWTGSFSFAPIRDEHGVIVGAVMACRDITQQLQAEATLVQALKDKDALLKEVHHRVKNNLQIVASLLRLERHRSTHPATQETLVTMLGRIRSMALLHGSLHRSGTLGSLDLAAYLSEVTGQAFKVHQVDATGVELTLDLVPVEAGMDQATPCGLLVNELISNALKHAFAPGQSGEICVRLYPDPEEGFWRLSVSDDGVGLPAGYKETRKASLGLQLASELAMQMGGHMETSSLPAQGARFEVRFRLTRPAALVMPVL